MRLFPPFAIAILLAGGMIAAAAADGFYCKYCGEKFTSADHGRLGICTYSSSKKHVVVSCANDNFIGATPQQIVKIMTHEGLMLSVAGIPLGLLLGIAGRPPRRKAWPAP